MHVCVCLLMKGSVSFDPNSAKFTQKIDECSGCVNSYIRPKTVQNCLKNLFQWFLNFFASRPPLHCFLPRPPPLQYIMYGSQPLILELGQMFQGQGQKSRSRSYLVWLFINLNTNQLLSL